MVCILRFWGPLLGIALIFCPFTHDCVHAGPNRLAPRQGVLLVADKQIADPRFRQAVVLLISHDMQYSAGLIINKPTGVTAGQLPHDPPASAQHRVYYGGPVEPGRAHLLLRSDDSTEGAARVLHGVYYLGSRPEPRLDKHKDVRLYLGYAGWAPGQLAAEIARGDWHVVSGYAEAVFSENIAGLWSRLYAEFEALWI